MQSPNHEKLKFALEGILDSSVTPMQYIEMVSAVHDEVLATLTPLQTLDFQKTLAERPVAYRQLISRSEAALDDLLKALDLMLQFPEGDKLESCRTGFEQASDAYRRLDEIAAGKGPS